MSWLEWFGARPTMARFTRKLVGELAAHGQQDWVVNEAGDALTREGSTINLHNLFLEYSSVARAERRTILQKYCALAASIERKPAKLWVAAAKHIFPVVRSRFDRAALDTQMRVEGHSPPATVSMPLCGDLHVRLVYDWGQHLAHLEQSQVAPWARPDAELFEAAGLNLRALPTPRWNLLRPGLMQLESDASYEESLVLVDRVRAALPFAAHAVFLPCNRGALLAAVGREPQALLAMAQTAARYFEERPWAMSACALNASGDGFVPALIDGEAGVILADLGKRHLAESYAVQCGVLRQADSSEDAAFHADFGLMRPGPDQPVRSWCSWADGVHGTLPRTDVVMMTRQREGAEPELLEVPWAVVERICAGLLTPTEDAPTRYRVSEFPDAAQWLLLCAEGRRLGK